MSKLTAIADQIRRQIDAKTFGWVKHTFTGGLEIVVSRNGEKYRLAMRRQNVFPSQTEIDLLLPLFGVAEGTELHWRRVDDKFSRAPSVIHWYIVEANWIEREPAPSMSVRARPCSSIDPQLAST